MAVCVGHRCSDLLDALSLTNMLYYAGRIFQLIGLLAMPSAMWIAQIEHDEGKSIGVFVGSLIVFYVGVLLVNAGKK